MWTSSGGFCPRSLKALICRNLPRSRWSFTPRSPGLVRVGSRAADVSGAANGSFGPDVGARSPSALTLARASRAGPPGWAESPEGFGVWCWFGEESVDAGLEVDDRAQHAAFEPPSFKETEMSRLDKRECRAFTFAIKIVLGRRPFYSAHAIAGAPLWPWNA